MFSHTGPNRLESKTTRMFRPVHQVAAPGRSLPSSTASCYYCRRHQRRKCDVEFTTFVFCTKQFTTSSVNNSFLNKTFVSNRLVYLRRSFFLLPTTTLVAWIGFSSMFDCFSRRYLRNQCSKDNQTWYTNVPRWVLAAHLFWGQQIKGQGHNICVGIPAQHYYRCCYVSDTGFFVRHVPAFACRWVFPGVGFALLWVPAFLVVVIRRVVCRRRRSTWRSGSTSTATWRRVTCSSVPRRRWSCATSASRGSSTPATSTASWPTVACRSSGWHSSRSATASSRHTVTSGRSESSSGK